MPTYEYKCQKCDYMFEKFQNMSEPKIKVCPQCGSDVHRLIGTGGGLIFKGKGFYATDYGHAGQRSPRCGRDHTCCGKDSPCETQPCDE